MSNSKDTFNPVQLQTDFPTLERRLMEHWDANGIVTKYLQKNIGSKKKFSFLDGPITANNPMGVHHAWGRTYKDLWQRYHNMKGEAGRFQNGFDCQGLWVEVEVEKELGFKSKKDIENYGVANFVNKCKERVMKYSAIQTQQSQRLGYFMDWDNSYFTMSDNNNYSIWEFLKECHSRGWIYKGHDSVPWCPRCETAISQHEILTEDYKEITHDSVFLKLPVIDRDAEYLLVWTTTPWTLPANVAVAVDSNINYSLISIDSKESYWVAEDLASKVFGKTKYKVLKTQKGTQLVGLSYSSPFDDLPAVVEVAKVNSGKFHIVVATDPLIMPITTTEGTGLVHTAVSAGEEDFKLGKKLGLPLIPVIADNADYLSNMGEFSGLNAKKHPEIILEYLKAHHQSESGSSWIFQILPYKHRYPACWRCKAELVWKVADEWYIAMDKEDPTHSDKLTFRQQMQEVVKQINWIPGFGLEREQDWLKNMHDWLISKKNRYWGLSLPIYECDSCRRFDVIGSKDELKKRAVSGWDKFEGNSPHKPWIDEVKIACSRCNQPLDRIPDVGNPWLDAGIVSISTMAKDWFPADFITESFPGQFKNWFYSLIAMSTVLRKSHPFKNVLGYASLLDETGRPMHKSWGNSIEFNEGADKMGVDVMRWMYAGQNPETNMLFGYKKADEVRRQFHLMLWNVYNFFVTYANTDGFAPGDASSIVSSNILDIWILARLKQLVFKVTDELEKFDAQSATVSITEFVNDLSLWYIRRSRDRVGPTADDNVDKQSCYQTIHYVLITLSKILAPFMPFITDEIFTNLTKQESVHLADWPTSESVNIDEEEIISQMKVVRKIVELGLSRRKDSNLKVRQPLRKIMVSWPTEKPSEALLQLVASELNIKTIDWKKAEDISVELDCVLDDNLMAEGRLRDLIRQVQEARKLAGAALDQQIILSAPLPDDLDLRKELQRKTLSLDMKEAREISVKLVE